MLANELNTILEDANRNYRSVNHHQPPIQLLLCGDFNSLPDSGKLYLFDVIII
jgi:CCR4-NOT transcription complex subunit 6